MEDSTTNRRKWVSVWNITRMALIWTVDAACRAELQGVLQTVASEVSEYDPEEIQKMSVGKEDRKGCADWPVIAFAGNQMDGL